MSRLLTAILLGGLLLLASPAFADEYAGAKLVSVGKGMIEFEKDGKKFKLPVSVSLKILDDKGETQDTITGVRFLAPGNVVDVKTTTDSKTKKDSIVQIKFVSGTVGELPKAPKNANLNPDPNFNGTIPEALPPNPYWEKYLPTAKVGDFVEYTRGKDEEPGREEAVEVGKGYVVVARVGYILGKRTETRVKMVASKGGSKSTTEPSKASSSSKKPSTPAKETEEITVAGKKLTCEIKKLSGKPYQWHCADVPFDGLVKEDARNTKYMLTDFGRGKE
jgi:hypothetical protein